MKKELNLLVEKIRGANSIVIVGHKNPDGDCVCATLALARLIELNFGKVPVCMYDGNFPNILDNVPNRTNMRYYGHVDVTRPFDLAFILDYGTEVNIGGLKNIVDNAGYRIEIDHHKNDNPVANLCLNDDAAAATGEIVFKIANELGWTRDDIINDLIALSLLTDTGFFKFARRGTVLRMMADLVDAGVNIEQLSNLLNNKPRKAVLTEAAVASRAEFFYRGRVALATVMRDDYKKLDGRSDTILNLLGHIRGVEYIVMLKQQKDTQTSVSLRSRAKPVNTVAEALGGGGHAFAAGAVVHDTLENVRARVLDLIGGELK